MDYMKGYKPIAEVYNKALVQLDPPIPLIGHIAFGVIDRGTNILQVRPSTLCPHNCIYCSVDAGPNSKTRAVEFLVNPKYLVNWVHEIADYKNTPVEALIDGVGEPLTHPQIIKIVKLLKQHRLVKRVAIETHGGFLSKPLIRKLDEAGVDRVNLSLDTLDEEKARMLSGVEWYSVSRILDLIEWTLGNTGLDIVLTPVVVPGYNEDDMKRLVEYAKTRGLGKKSGWPTGILIQKFERHKWGRKPPGTKEWSWHHFYRWLAKLEQETQYILRPKTEDLGIKWARKIEEPYRKGERVKLTIVGKGWHKGEYLGVDYRGLRVFAVYCNNCSIGQHVSAKITRSKNNIYVAIRK